METYLETKDFIIRKSPFDPEKLWMERASGEWEGEATEVNPDQLNEWLEKFFNEVM